MRKTDAPLSLFELGIRLRPTRGYDGRTTVYIEPHGIRVAIHPDAKGAPTDGPFEKSTFFLPGGVRRAEGNVSAMTCLSNQMTGLISLHQRLFTTDVQPEYAWQSQQKINEALRRNRKNPTLFLPTRRIHFPR